MKEENIVAKQSGFWSFIGKLEFRIRDRLGLKRQVGTDHFSLQNARSSLHLLDHQQETHHMNPFDQSQQVLAELARKNGAVDAMDEVVLSIDTERLDFEAALMRPIGPSMPDRQPVTVEFPF